MESFCNNYVDAGTILLSKERVSIFWNGVYIIYFKSVNNPRFNFNASFRFVVNKHVSETAN